MHRPGRTGERQPLAAVRPGLRRPAPAGDLVDAGLADKHDARRRLVAPELAVEPGVRTPITFPALLVTEHDKDQFGPVGVVVLCP